MLVMAKTERVCMQLAYYCLEALPFEPLRVPVYCHCLLDLIGLEYKE